MISGANEKQLELANARADILLLQQENQELKKQLEDLQETHYLIQGGRSNGKTYLMKLQADKEQLNSLVNSCQEEIRRLKKQLEEKENIACNWKDSCLENAGEIEKLENQQKKFIEFLENEKDRLAMECSQIYEDSLGKTKLVNEDIFNEVDKILSKYQEIIGGKE